MVFPSKTLIYDVWLGLYVEHDRSASSVRRIRTKWQREAMTTTTTTAHADESVKTKKTKSPKGSRKIYIYVKTRIVLRHTILRSEHQVKRRVYLTDTLPVQSKSNAAQRTQRKKKPNRTLQRQILQYKQQQLLSFFRVLYFDVWFTELLYSKWLQCSQC